MTDANTGAPETSGCYDHIVPDHHDDDPVPVGDLNAEQKRAEIAYTVGTNERRLSTLSKTTLNSAYAYLEGEFACPPRDLNNAEPENTVPNTPTIRRLLLGAAGGPGDVIEAMGRRGEHPEVREYLSGELSTILEAIRGTRDQRDWASP